MNPHGDHLRTSQGRDPNSPPGLRDGARTAQPSDMAKELLFAFTNRHRGKAIELDSAQDTVRVLGPAGEQLAIVNSDVALDHLLNCAQEIGAQESDGHDPADAPASVSLLVPAKPLRISVRTADGRTFDARSPLIGPEGLFLESSLSLAVGGQLELVLVPPGDTARRLRMKGIVAWICPKPDEFGFGPGVGVTGTALSPELVDYLRNARSPLTKRDAVTH